MSKPSTGALPQSFLAPVDAGRFAGGCGFPIITHIDEMKAAVREESGIGFFQQGPIVICRYTIAIPEVFQTAWDLECRGLVFDAHTGVLLSRPLHKFFNLGERQGLLDLDLSAGWRLEEKLDGSMISSFLMDGEIVFHTRGGVSKQARAARRSAPKNVLSLAHAAAEIGATPIFEWTAPDNRVVIAYEQEALTLLALRDIRTGRYLDPHGLAAEFGVPVAAPLARDIRSSEELVAAYEALVHRTDIEGAVLVGPGGHRVKLKTADYLKRHKILANLGNERYAYQAWIDDVVDDTAAALGGRRGQALVDFSARIEARICELDAEIGRTVGDLATSDRKHAAQAIQQRLGGTRQALAFATLGGAGIRDRLRDILFKRVATPEKRTALKRELGLPDWEADLLELE